MIILENSTSPIDKIRGALMGLAIGDALGGPTEFQTPQYIKENYGYLTEMIGGGVFQLKPGETTDDTAMTLAVAKGIIRDKDNPLPAFGEEFIKWWKTKPKDIGNTVRIAIEQFSEGHPWEEAAKNAHGLLGGQSAGNGTLMRCVPIALVYKDLKRMEEITVAESKMTHFDDLAAEACVIYNRIVYRTFRENKDLIAAIQKEVKGTRYDCDLTARPSVIESGYPYPSGYVVDTFKWVLHFLVTSTSFEDVVQRAANAGGDSDTTASIAGALAGLACGYDKLPPRYIASLLGKKEILQVADNLTSIAE